MALAIAVLSDLLPAAEIEDAISYACGASGQAGKLPGGEFAGGVVEVACEGGVAEADDKGVEGDEGGVCLFLLEGLLEGLVVVVVFGVADLGWFGDGHAWTRTRRVFRHDCGLCVRVCEVGLCDGEMSFGVGGNGSSQRYRDSLGCRGVVGR